MQIVFHFSVLNQQNNILKSNCRMNQIPSPHHPNLQNLSKHQCCQCLQNEAILTKYKKLVDLLYKKIRQLQKKSKIQIQPPQTEHSSQPSAKKEEVNPPLITVEDNMAKSIDDASTLHSQGKPWLQQSPSMILKCQSAKAQRSKGGDLTQIEKLQKVSIVINGLTEQVMQLKTNLMHIRYCIYAVFKQLNIGDKISSNPIALNIILTLLRIFEFSQNEKEEMFNHKKVKLRRKEKGKNKENIFITVKQI